MFRMENELVSEIDASSLVQRVTGEKDTTTQPSWQFTVRVRVRLRIKV